MTPYEAAKPTQTKIMDTTKSPTELAAVPGYAFQCKCGSTTFTRSSYVRGTWETLIEFTEDGRVKTEGCGDCVRTVAYSKTMSCAGCGKRCKAPAIPGLA